MKYCLAIIYYFIISSTAFSQLSEKNYRIKSINEANINIDGKLTEDTWQNAKWETGFIQYQPREGEKPSQQTEFAIFQSGNNLFIGIRAKDENPENISGRATRRDNLDGDWVQLLFDSYFDRRTAFGFGVSAAGTKSDFIISNDSKDGDYNWDPIWHVMVNKTQTGWNAEMEIPLTQLRFKKSEDQKWGFQVARHIFRKEELSVWQPMKREEMGYVSQFGIVSGIKASGSKNTIDIVPYVVGRTIRFQKSPGNPFKSSGKENSIKGGLDAKFGLSNNIIMDLTFNPDFGQVEADPSVVNLSAFETFFQEKRPFFVEGKNILSFKLLAGGGDVESENLFYSRRIGRAPHGSAILNKGEYADKASFSQILGALKVSGKTQNGWSIGILESMTNKEFAQIRGMDSKRTQLVEPLTNYFVTRIQKDFNDGNTYLGGIFTAVNRNIENTYVDFLHESAYSGGLDLVHKWNNKKWQITTKTYFSSVSGTTKAITQTQESFARTFQRTDADYLSVDTSLTTLNGYGGNFSFGEYEGNQNFLLNVSWKSPGLELNDIGYLKKTDDIFQSFWTGYYFYEPYGIFRQANIDLSQWISWDFGGNMKSKGGSVAFNCQLNNYWGVYSNLGISGEQIHNSLLRGGPAIITPGNFNIGFGLFSNQQKKLSLNASADYLWSFEKDFSSNINYYLGINFRPVNSLSFNLSTNYNAYLDNLQYVTHSYYKEDIRYIASYIDFTTLSLSLRMNLNITPDFTIQFWGQPFVSSGEYSKFKYITNSKADDLNDRFRLFEPTQISYSKEQNTYFIDENKDLNVDYSIYNPNFHITDFIGNLVLRWEYLPGSTIYFVWSQYRYGYKEEPSLDWKKDLTQLLTKTQPYSIFLIKFSLRIGN